MNTCSMDAFNFSIMSVICLEILCRKKKKECRQFKTIKKK